MPTSPTPRPTRPIRPGARRSSAARTRAASPPWAPDQTYNKTPGDDDWLIRHFYLPLDESVARIRAKVEALGLSRRTIIWFISDNGGTRNNFSLSPNTREGKNSMYEGGHRVPGIVWAPGRIEPGGVSDALILSFDIMPTSMAMAGVSAPEGHRLDGIDVGRALFEGRALRNNPRFWNQQKRGAMRDGHWKLVVTGNRRELFDLSQDPKEKKNLAAKHPDRVAQMHAAYQAFVVKTRADSPYDMQAIIKQLGAGTAVP